MLSPSLWKQLPRYTNWWTFSIWTFSSDMSGWYWLRGRHSCWEQRWRPQLWRPTEDCYMELWRSLKDRAKLQHIKKIRYMPGHFVSHNAFKTLSRILQYMKKMIGTVSFRKLFWVVQGFEPGPNSKLSTNWAIQHTKSVELETCLSRSYSKSVRSVKLMNWFDIELNTCVYVNYRGQYSHLSGILNL